MAINAVTTTSLNDFTNSALVVPFVIAALSEQVELAAGDLIYTGTPAGVGPVQRGDVLQAQIAGLVPLAVTIV
jgi:fumarylpyruvate hydrolase